MNGCGSFRLGYVGVGFGGNCDCRYGILCAGGWFLWVWLFWLLLLILRNFLFPAGVVVLLRYKYHHLAIFIVVF